MIDRQYITNTYPALIKNVNKTYFMYRKWKMLKAYLNTRAAVELSDSSAHD